MPYSASLIIKVIRDVIQVREQTSRSDTPEEREGNVIHSRSTVAVMTRKFTTQKTVPLIYDKDAQSVVVKGLAVEASFDWDLKLL